MNYFVCIFLWLELLISLTEGKCNRIFPLFRENLFTFSQFRKIHQKNFSASAIFVVHSDTHAYIIWKVHNSDLCKTGVSWVPWLWHCFCWFYERKRAQAAYIDSTMYTVHTCRATIIIRVGGKQSKNVFILTWYAYSVVGRGLREIWI